ncbi:hypothetical protein BDM02DRAFT_3121500 [Thelephora ganbajun]|uniref:Uncharacterized protein n=1 Tax=Thelephora ganbajun TaxID=370292 RepID=A0ACB6Z4X7_THEGA|nr:hypothetical protein BDM02DRAFT_3121500 [Thelephora ganbajun]
MESSKQLSVPDNWTVGRVWSRRNCDLGKSGTQAWVLGACINGLECKQSISLASSLHITRTEPPNCRSGQYSCPEICPPSGVQYYNFFGFSPSIRQSGQSQFKESP